MTTLVQILLPLADNDGNLFSEDMLRSIQSELSDKFGGLTAYARAPAHGVWNQGDGQANDDIIVVEVMIEQVDVAWWKAFKARMELELRQAEVVIRTQNIRLF